MNCEDDIDECKVSSRTFSLVVLGNMFNIFLTTGGGGGGGGGGG